MKGLKKIVWRSDDKETFVDTATPFDMPRSSEDLDVSIGTELPAGLEGLPYSHRNPTNKNWYLMIRLGSKFHAYWQHELLAAIQQALTCDGD